MEVASIRARVRQLVEAGELPCEPGKVWAGRGVGDTCVACGQSIDPTEIEYEIELSSGRILRLHRACHQIWTDECDPVTGVASHG